MESVNHPEHYGGVDNPFEAIKVIEAWGLDFYTGNAVKYICRAGKKNPDKEIEDFEKALWYLEKKIKKLKQERLNTNFVATHFFKNRKDSDGGC